MARVDLQNQRDTTRNEVHQNGTDREQNRSRDIRLWSALNKRCCQELRLDESMTCAWFLQRKVQAELPEAAFPQAPRDRPGLRERSWDLIDGSLVLERRREKTDRTTSRCPLRRCDDSVRGSPSSPHVAKLPPSKFGDSRGIHHDSRLNSGSVLYTKVLFACKTPGASTSLKWSLSSG